MQEKFQKGALLQAQINFSNNESSYFLFRQRKKATSLSRPN